jgi:hypothetical protein
VWAWSLAFSPIITAVVMLDLRRMQWVANVALFLFLPIVGWAVVIEPQKHDVLRLVPRSGRSMGDASRTRTRTPPRASRRTTTTCPNRSGLRRLLQVDLANADKRRPCAARAGRRGRQAGTGSGASSARLARYSSAAGCRANSTISTACAFRASSTSSGVT